MHRAAVTLTPILFIHHLSLSTGNYKNNKNIKDNYIAVSLHIHNTHTLFRRRHCSQHLAELYQNSPFKTMDKNDQMMEFFDFINFFFDSHF